MIRFLGVRRLSSEGLYLNFFLGWGRPSRDGVPLDVELLNPESPAIPSDRSERSQRAIAASVTCNASRPPSREDRGDRSERYM